VTPNLALPYPELNDPVDVPGDIEKLAERVDDVLPRSLNGSGGPPSIGDTLPDGTTLADLRHGDIYYQHV
jgi:hypothetical protein